nr:pilin [Candidatus Competibacteraceae bacterium]
VATGVNTGIQSKTLTLSPVVNNGSIDWTCTSNAQQKFVPKVCTGTGT